MKAAKSSPVTLVQPESWADTRATTVRLSSDMQTDAERIRELVSEAMASAFLIFEEHDTPPDERADLYDTLGHIAVEARSIITNAVEVPIELPPDTALVRRGEVAP
jgi:hypothetical protein